MAPPPFSSQCCAEGLPAVVCAASLPLSLLPCCCFFYNVCAVQQLPMSRRTKGAPKKRTVPPTEDKEEEEGDNNGNEQQPKTPPERVSKRKDSLSWSVDCERKPKHPGPLWYAAKQIWDLLLEDAKQHWSSTYQLMLGLCIAAEVHTVQGDVSRLCFYQEGMESIAQIPIAVDAIKMSDRLQWVKVSQDCVLGEDELDLASAGIEWNDLKLFSLLKDHKTNAATFRNCLSAFLRNNRGNNERQTELAFLYNRYHRLVQDMAANGDFAYVVNSARPMRSVSPSSMAAQPAAPTQNITPQQSHQNRTPRDDTVAKQTARAASKIRVRRLLELDEAVQLEAARQQKYGHLEAIRQIHALFPQLAGEEEM